ncbi:MAG: tetratricopeptide repeat protein [Deltaproteobacteria bacterium]|nr:tetratricopeptide repeat protein [Deltaproteobacteria bacterium]MBW2444999.1 tetratricopeptide repeat protein [Deltaproteobacteria bacterium]
MTVRSLRLRWVALALVATLSGGCQDDGTRIQKHLERAEAYAEEEAWPEAIIEYKSALQLDPNAAAAHYGLSQAFIKTNKLRQGYWELRETARLDPTNVEARLQFAQLSRLAGEFEESLLQSDAIIALEPEHESAHMLRGQALEGLERPDEALEAYRRAKEVTPDQGAAILLLANFLRKTGDRAAAEPLFRELTEKDQSFAASIAWASFLSEEPGRLDEAEQAYRQALELADDERKSLAYRTLASFYYRLERVMEAEQVLRDGIEERPDDLQLIYLLARFYRSQDRGEEADEMIQAATRARPDDVQPQLILSLYRGRQGDRDGALEAAEAALAIDKTSVAARLRKAELLVDIGSLEGKRDLIAQGRAIVDAILAEDSSSAEGLFVRAKVQLADGELDAAIGDLRRVMDLRTGWAQAHLMLGSALYLRGDHLAARSELQRALEADAGLLEARKMLARVQSALGENEAAVEEGRRFLSENVGDDGLRILVAQSLVRQRKFDEGLAELQRIPPERRNAEVLYAIGRIHRFEGNDQLARSFFERALEQRPDNADLLRAALELDQREGRLENSSARIGAALEADPDNPDLVHLAGLAALLSGDRREAEKKLRRAIDLNPNELRFYETLARYFQATGRTSDMLTTYEKAVAARPDSAPLQLIVGTLYELRGESDKASESYERAIAIDPELAPAKNNLAYMLAERGENLDRALDLAQEAKAMLPDNPNTADTLGWVLYKKGIPSAAIGYLQEADEGFDTRNPSFGLVRHHLALAYQANGENDKARTTLERALEDLEQALEGRPGAKEPAWAADLRSMLSELEG